MEEGREWMVLRNGSTLSSDWSEANGTSADASTSQAIRVDELDHFDEAWIKPFPLRDGLKIRKGEKFSDYYSLFEEIGEGKFGKVYRCMEKATNLMLAAKCIKIRKDTDFEKVEKEVNIMTQMRHKCIAQIYDAFATTDNDVILVMEIVEGGELFDRVADDSYILTEMAVALIMFQICEAIRYIHNQNIIHLDLKPENIMCVSQSSNQIKLIDFGLAQWYDGSKDLMFMAGTPEFAAPEVIKYEPLDFHTDMWSLGVISYILLSGQSPFLGETLAHTYCNVERGNWMFCEEFAENAISSDAKDFISRLLIVEKEKRMLPNLCLRHPWIVKNRERALLASRAASPAVCHPLAVDKFRKYVKNKRFRRLVFGVLFINQVMRMMQTMQRNKSAHGVEYVRNMLVAAEAAETASPTEAEGQDGERNLLMKAFSQKKPTIVVEDEEREEKMDEGKEEGQKPRRRKVVVKKKRPKSDRASSERQRSRSSTEQTSNKKQRQDEEVRRRKESGEREEERKTQNEATRTKAVKFEQEEQQQQQKSPMAPWKRVGDSKVLKMAARLQEEQPSTVAQRRSPEATKRVSSSNVSSLLKRLEQKGQENSTNTNTAAAKGEGGGKTTPLAFAVTMIQPQKSKEVKETEEGTMDRKKTKKVVKVKKVRRVRTAEGDERQQKSEKNDGEQGMSRREQEKAEFRKRIAEMEQKGGGGGGTKVQMMNGKRTEEEEKGMMKRKEGGREREEAVENGNGGGMIRKNDEMKKQQQPQVVVMSPRAKQRLKLSNSHPLENNRNRQRMMSRDESEEESSGWSAVGQDVFDFSLLRTKLQNRILGLKDREDKATEAENQHRFELQKQQKMLQTNLNIKRAMRKWISMDKESKQQQSAGRCRERPGHPVAIPEWAL